MADTGATLEKVLKDFDRNVQSVYELANFDRFVMDFAIEQVSRLNARLSRFANPADTGEHTLQALRNVREHDSLRHHYKTIANQGVVLLVSYFGSAIGDIFRASIPLALSRGTRPQLLREELRLTLEELETLRTEPETLGDIFAAKKDISFQDMQSIARAFKEYIGIELPRDVAVNDIILAQACRHVIVHAGSVADRRLTKQVGQALPRSVKPHIQEGEAIQFAPDELTVIGAAMTGCVRRIVSAVEQTPTC